MYVHFVQAVYLHGLILLYNNAGLPSPKHSNLQYLLVVTLYRNMINNVITSIATHGKYSHGN
jgi:hypothetical protein